VHACACAQAAAAHRGTLSKFQCASGRRTPGGSVTVARDPVARPLGDRDVQRPGLCAR
jgi:hypothetical protein